MDPPPPQRGVGPTAPRQGPTDRRTVEQVRRFRPGDAVVRVTRPKYTGFARRGAGRIEASLTLEEPRGAWGKLWRVLVGSPIHSELEIHERLTKKKALAVFSSDALSSVAYAPQETLVVLLAAGTAAIRSGFARRGAGRIEASLTLEEPRGAWGKLWRVLVGSPIHSELEIHERLTKKKALAVFSSDALSSVAYAPQETLVVLLAAGTAAI